MNIITVLYNTLYHGFVVSLGELAVVFLLGLSVGVIIERVKK
jgi:hypothetical protein